MLESHDREHRDEPVTEPDFLRWFGSQGNPECNPLATTSTTTKNLQDSQNKFENPFLKINMKKRLSTPVKEPKRLRSNEYGRPKAGSLTEARGKSANLQVYREIYQLCQIIFDHGKRLDSKPESRIKRTITFGELFEIYVSINNKVLGLLLRARKYGLLTFEGECLFQRFHDHVPITLMHSLEEIKEVLNERQEDIEAHGCKIVKTDNDDDD